jgi:hypothetical protein
MATQPILNSSEQTEVVFRVANPPRARKIEACGINAGSRRRGWCISNRAGKPMEILNETIDDTKIARQLDKT